MRNRFLFRILINLFFLVACSDNVEAVIPVRMDGSKPFGWALCTSLEGGEKYNLNGGEGGRQIVLKSDGGDMRGKIADAINEYDIIILDGSGGEFLISSSMEFTGLRNKTIYGINRACLNTAFKLSDEMLEALVASGAREMTNEVVNQRLSNNTRVSEKIEYYTRQAIIDFTGDQSESYRKSGIMIFHEAENIIVRNLEMNGPGAVDIAGHNLLLFTDFSKHIWIDHCTFRNSLKCHLCVGYNSDFITVSWCRFLYDGNFYNHCFSCLICGTAKPEYGKDHMNMTFAFCHWGEGCKMRMPMVRYGHTHVMNCYYDCDSPNVTVNAREESFFLVEGNYYTEAVDGKCFSQSKASAWTYRDNYSEKPRQVQNNGDVTVPYDYKLAAATDVPEMVLDSGRGAGNVL